ncbi:MAG: GAF domain-containing protein [Desulfobacula sp.]|jgi:class 3 adenylate cyclase/putative methionine-R-sulfoxide reductase with GAF domain|uniref:adenylate/guanylate cyclase domain-containing protein n=2 Tax=Desulfobacula sp. TaxID=2593537 RepID=UPI001D4AEC77|nr:GAF domain-containing protein [Desulfobacula sp.]MBT3485256.1 GAF domain-containing protein [Desulfobacula sp.]MBT3804737.1 GAF domain-containing protein [Desulfobacula sp.]MBT4025215.1 GAF domain-containing protein [Desulfobacula sp.]MBT4200671.1 GAF domain-containing protein [Desulfobacula sp.]
MDRYYKERFHAQQNLIRKTAPLMEVNEIIEKVREELRKIIPNAMEVCILLLDPEAGNYTSPLQCALYEQPVNCQSCKRNRPAVQKAIQKKKAVVVSQSEPVRRMDNSLVAVGSEYAMPVFVEDRVLATISVVIQPLTRYTRRDFFLIRDFADILGNIILNAKRQWEITQDKIRISRKLNHLTPFVPGSVRHMVDKNPELLTLEKERKEVTILFLDLEGYTSLSSRWPETQVNAIIEKMFSSFVDPIHRSQGDINETAGDALMIIFKDHDAKTNAINAVKAAFEIVDQNRAFNLSLDPEIGAIDVNIGINSGSALVGMSRFKGLLHTRMTFTATGRVTNIAARLSDHAKLGDILIGEETQKMVAGLWPVYPLGPVSLKGVKDPVLVFSLLRSPESKPVK